MASRQEIQNCMEPCTQVKMQEDNLKTSGFSSEALKQSTIDSLNETKRNLQEI